jgi:hypothetical protein
MRARELHAIIKSLTSPSLSFKERTSESTFLNCNLRKRFIIYHIAVEFIDSWLNCECNVQVIKNRTKRKHHPKYISTNSEINESLILGSLIFESWKNDRIQNKYPTNLQREQKYPTC